MEPPGSIFNKQVTSLAEAVGFEPTGRFRPPVFKTGAIDRSATPPNKNCGATGNRNQVPCVQSRYNSHYTMTPKKNIFVFLCILVRIFG